LVNPEILQYLDDEGPLGLTVVGKYGNGQKNISLVSFCLVRAGVGLGLSQCQTYFHHAGRGTEPPVEQAAKSKRKNIFSQSLREKASSLLAGRTQGETDSASLLSKAEHQEDKYLLTGSKFFISKAPIQMFTPFSSRRIREKAPKESPVS